MRVRTRKDLGLLIKERRRKLGLTQAQLAELVGVNRRWVVQVEQAKTSADLRTLLRALRVLGAELHVTPTSPSVATNELDEIVDSPPASRS